MVSEHATTMKSAARREFDGWAETYDRSWINPLFFEPTYRTLLEEIVRWRGDDRTPIAALDIGCGTGTLATLLAGSSLPVHVTALDYTPVMIRLARDKARHAGLLDACTFVRGDAEHLPVESRRFDLVTCSHSFHHYPDQQAAVIEMRRVLRPGGRLMLADAFRDNVIGWFVFDVCVAAVEKAIHHVPWSQVREMFLRAGFRDVRQRKFNWWAPVLLNVGTA